MPVRSLDDCLRTSGLARYASHAERLLRLQRLLEANLPRPLARSSRVANLRQGRVFIHANGNAAAAKLRQIIPTLVRVFRDVEAEVTGIEVKAQPVPVNAAATRREPAPPPGAKVKRGIAALADTLPEDSPLRGALRKVLQHAG